MMEVEVRGEDERRREERGRVVETRGKNILFNHLNNAMYPLCKSRNTQRKHLWTATTDIYVTHPQCHT